jgi:hypothetical protein
MAKKTFDKATTQVMNKASEQKRNSDEAIKEQMIILPELESLIPALSVDEYEQLRTNIDNEGCREPLILWHRNSQDFVLIDGHNRYKICKELDRNFDITVMEFPDIDDVKDWMINNQLGKRNVTDHVKSYLRGLQYNREKRKSGEPKAFLEAPKDENQIPQRTNERLAEQHRVSAKTIERDEKFALGLEKLTEGDKILKTKILNKEIQINKSIIEGLANKSALDVQKVREGLQTGNLSSVLDETKKQDDSDLAYKDVIKRLSLAIQNKSKDEAKKLLKSLSDTIEKL